MTEAVFANISQLEDMFSEEEGESWTETEATEEEQPEQTFEVLKMVAENKKYETKPINVTLEEVSFKKSNECLRRSAVRYK
nr:hypothetical protein [Planococcus glaciei]